MNRFYKNKGFTLLEVLVAMMIVAIVLTAAATMAGALSSAKTANDQMNRETTSLLQIQTRLSDLIMRANEVTLCQAGKLILWHDDNADGVQSADNSEYTTLSTDGTNLTIYKNNDLTNKEMYRNCQLTDISGNEFLPNTTWVRVKFTLTENGTSQTYMVCASLRAKMN